MRGDIATRVAARMAARTVRAYEPDAPADYPSGEPCIGLDGNGCTNGNTADCPEVGLCEQCMAGVVVTALEKYLPWDDIEAKMPDEYAQLDQQFQQWKTQAGGQQAKEQDLDKHPHIVQVIQGLGQQVSSKLDGQMTTEK